MNERLIKVTGYNCPICNEDFTALRVREGAPKFLDTDTDLRPYYEDIDPVKYEVVTCKYCGYSSVSKTFDKVRSDRIDIIADKLEKIYDNRSFSDDSEYDYDTAIYRYKLAIKIADERIMTKGELFYLYLKLAWLFRAMKSEKSIKYEYLSLKRALEYGEYALENESMPAVDIDGDVLTFLLGEISRRLGHFDKALKYTAQIVTNQAVPQRLKERAKHTKECIKIDKIFFGKETN